MEIFVFDMFTVTILEPIDFPNKKYCQDIFVFSFGLFPVFTCQIASYQLRKDRKTSLKETSKPDPNKIYTGC